MVRGDRQSAQKRVALHGEMTITPVRDSDGEISHFIAIKQDISERKRAEHDLARESALLRALMDNVPDFIYFKDRETGSYGSILHSPGDSD